MHAQVIFNLLLQHPKTDSEVSLDHNFDNGSPVILAPASACKQTPSPHPIFCANIKLECHQFLVASSSWK